MPFGVMPDLTRRQVVPLTFTCLRGTVDAVALLQVVGIPQPSSFLIRSPGAPEVFLAGISPERLQGLVGREVTACGVLALFFGTGPFAGQSVLGLFPLFLV